MLGTILALLWTNLMTQAHAEPGPGGLLEAIGADGDAGSVEVELSGISDEPNGWEHVTPIAPPPPRDTRIVPLTVKRPVFVKEAPGLQLHLLHLDLAPRIFGALRECAADWGASEPNAEFTYDVELAVSPSGPNDQGELKLLDVRAPGDGPRCVEDTLRTALFGTTEIAVFEGAQPKKSTVAIRLELTPPKWASIGGPPPS